MADVTHEVGDLPASRIGLIPMTILEPGEYLLLRDIPVALEPADDGYTATFFDANISASGDTWALFHRRLR
jgi:hypothetical protein